MDFPGAVLWFLSSLVTFYILSHAGENRTNSTLTSNVSGEWKSPLYDPGNSTGTPAEFDSAAPTPSSQEPSAALRDPGNATSTPTPSSQEPNAALRDPGNATSTPTPSSQEPSPEPNVYNRVNSASTPTSSSPEPNAALYDPDNSTSTPAEFGSAASTSSSPGRNVYDPDNSTSTPAPGSPGRNAARKAASFDPDNPTSTPPEDDSDAPTSSAPKRPTASPSMDPQPLPLSGRLLAPVDNVGSLCPCDEHVDVCDLNCCCDRECVKDFDLFTACSVLTVRGNQRLCSQPVASYSLESTVDGYSKVKTSVQIETNHDIFCIQSQNHGDGFAHPSPALPTDRDFDSLFERFTSSFFSSESSSQVSTAEPQSGYQYGDVMVTAAERGQTGLLRLPAPGVTADCVDSSPAAFLQDQSSRCSRRVVLQQDCSALSALSMGPYTSIKLLAGRNPDAAVVPVEVSAVVLQSVEGTQSQLQVAGGENLNAVLLSPDLCANVVLKVFYVVKYSPAGEILNVNVSLLLGFVRESSLPLQQEFGIKFVQEDVEEDAVLYSGNPGYITGLPLLSGTRTSDGIVRSIDPGDTLTLLHSRGDQDCLQGLHQRSPILFGLDSMSGCTLRIEDASNCSLVVQSLLDVLRGTSYPQYVASFGNSPLENPLDWVPIQRSFDTEDSQGCSIPLSLHFEIEWTKYGSLVNPQARIVSIKEVIQTDPTGWALTSKGSSVLPIRSSVAFLPVSVAATPAYRATPTIDAKLPSDFFSPVI
ncbi:tectonic-1-like isoform X2 [Antennarius striatus]|uniref:tectonic-1-like isoform X2 n=1 Tax=Antennarius striatus TaxID=241820 RepID=UPI0035B12D71